MKLALTVDGQAENPKLDQRFGRCPYFLIVDTVTQDRIFLRNPGLDSERGAGTQAAQYLINNRVEVIVSGHFGPNAYSALDAAGIQMYSANDGKVDTLLTDFQAGKLPRAEPQGGGRHGRGRRR
jgi:predicted Fe-Mo cluster-binding NifX family protein